MISGAKSFISCSIISIAFLRKRSTDLSDTPKCWAISAVLACFIWLITNATRHSSRIFASVCSSRSSSSLTPSRSSGRTLMSILAAAYEL